MTNLLDYLAPPILAILYIDYIMVPLMWITDVLLLCLIFISAWNKCHSDATIPPMSKFIQLVFSKVNMALVTMVTGLAITYTSGIVIIWSELYADERSLFIGTTCMWGSSFFWETGYVLLVWYRSKSIVELRGKLFYKLVFVFMLVDIGLFAIQYSFAESMIFRSENNTARSVVYNYVSVVSGFVTLLYDITLAVTYYDYLKKNTNVFSSESNERVSVLSSKASKVQANLATIARYGIIASGFFGVAVVFILFADGVPAVEYYSNLLLEIMLLLVSASALTLICMKIQLEGGFRQILGSTTSTLVLVLSHNSNAPQRRKTLGSVQEA